MVLIKNCLKRVLEVNRTPSPSGSLTKSDIAQSLGFGAIAGPLAMWGNSFLGILYSSLPAALHGIINADTVSVIMGFVFGSIVALLWKLIHNIK